MQWLWYESELVSRFPSYQIVFHCNDPKMQSNKTFLQKNVWYREYLSTSSALSRAKSVDSIHGNRAGTWQQDLQINTLTLNVQISLAYLVTELDIPCNAVDICWSMRLFCVAVPCSCALLIHTFSICVTSVLELLEWELTVFVSGWIGWEETDMRYNNAFFKTTYIC